MCESIHILVILKYRLVYIYISNTIILYSNSNNGEKKSDDTRFSTVISRRYNPFESSSLEPICRAR